MAIANLHELLQQSISTGNIDEVRKLQVSSPRDFSHAIRTNSIEQAFIDATPTMQLDSISHFVELGFDLNRHDMEGLAPTGIYPLNECITCNSWHQVKRLLELGADPNLAAALASVAELKGGPAAQLKMAKLLLDKGADINRSRDGHSPLSWALKKGRVELANYLRKRGAIEIDVSESESLLDLSTFQERLELAITLCWNSAVERYPDDHFCLFGLETDSDFVVVSPLFDSMHAIDRDVLNRRNSNSYVGKVSLDSDSELYGLGKEHFEELSKELNSCYLKPSSDEENEKRITTLREVFESSLEDLDRAGLFGSQNKREGIILLVSIIDADDEEWTLMLKIAKRLNPPSVFEQFVASLNST